MCQLAPCMWQLTGGDDGVARMHATSEACSPERRDRTTPSTPCHPRPPQSIVIILAVGMICWWNFRRVPFYRAEVNVVWSALWFGILYVTLLLAYLVFGKDHSRDHQREVTLVSRRRHASYLALLQSMHVAMSTVQAV